MNTGQKILLFCALFIADFAFFFIPIGVCFFGYILFFRPLWFRDWVLALYSGE